MEGTEAIQELQRQAVSGQVPGAGGPAPGNTGPSPRVGWEKVDTEFRIKYIDKKEEKKYYPGNGLSYCQKMIDDVYRQVAQAAVDIRALGYNDTGFLVMGWLEQDGGKVKVYDPCATGVPAAAKQQATDVLFVLKDVIKSAIRTETGLRVVKVCCH